jgi:CubicO group peptidase (beta-lactamase class C family)
MCRLRAIATTLLMSSFALAVTVAASVAIRERQSTGDANASIESALLPPVIVKDQPVSTRSLEQRMRELKVPGVSAAIFRNGRVEWRGEYGLADVESGRHVDRHTRFQAASISKPVAAAVVLALVSQGRLSLDVDVNTLLTSWKLPDNEHTKASPVTLRRLLTHSAGTTVHGFRGYAAGEEVPTLVQLLDGVKPANSAAIRVDIPVGSRWRYSGGGISIAQLVVEDVTRRPFADVARETVLQPFDMSDSTYVQPLPADLRDKAASGYRASGEPVKGKWHTYPEQAAAGLWTTPVDLAKFAIELQRIDSGQSNKVMSQELAQEMLRRQVDNWGLGISVTGEGAATYFGHGGANEGFRATLVGYRDHASGAVVMTNSDAGMAIASEIVRTAAYKYGFAGLGPVERTRGTADPKTYSDFAGYYDLPGRTPPVLHVIAEDGRLFRSTGPAPTQRSELVPESADTFFALDADVRIRFVREGGKVTEAQIEIGGKEQRAPRRDDP